MFTSNATNVNREDTITLHPDNNNIVNIIKQNNQILWLKENKLQIIYKINMEFKGNTYESIKIVPMFKTKKYKLADNFFKKQVEIQEISRKLAPLVKNT